MIMDLKSVLKPALAYVGIILIFFALSYAYAPGAFSGKVINQSDASGWIGMTHEISEHNATHPDDKTQWTNSMFGGMPTVAMYDQFEGDWTNPLYKGLMKLAPRPVNFFFISLLGAFLMMLAFGVNKWLAVAGAIAVTFCSYNLQIIQVGHNTKMQAIAFMPWVIAALVFTFQSALVRLEGSAGAGGNAAGRGAGPGLEVNAVGASAGATGWKSWLPKTVLGAVLFALALSFQIKANHQQVSYYLAIIVILYAVTLLFWLCASKKRRSAVGRFFAASVLLLVVGGVGIATNCNKLIPTYRYTPYTMRGGSELSSDSDTHSDKGLDLAYATAWSYGIEETPNLLIPNFNGGSSAGALGKDSQTYKLLQRAGGKNLSSVMKALPLYWGPQPFTAGPMYMGAITIFLFILGLCLHRDKEKWWLLVATVIAIFLAWGSHFMWFTKLWYNYAPLYNKFRTVSMALVTLQITLPVLGFIVLDKILKNGYGQKELLRGTIIAFSITGGFCLICILFPGIAGSFTGAVDAGQPDILVEALAADRRHLLVSDAGRSLSLIALTVVLVSFLFGLFGKNIKYSQSTRTGILAIALCCMMVIDLWSVGKRYLNNDHFVSKRDFTGQFAPRTVDKIIKEDPQLDYRVLDISVNTFNDAYQSYHHRCIGGYSPAKLQRYQDLIERYLTGEINSLIRTVNSSSTLGEVQENLPYLPIVSMLNGKYMIIGGDYAPVVNPNAFGNAWFVDDFVDAATPDEEIALLGTVDPHNTAVVGADFAGEVASVRNANHIKTNDNLAGNNIAAEATDNATGDYIELTHYAPNELRYHYKAGSDRAVLFSEIYYPHGWTLKYIPLNGELGNENTENWKVRNGNMAIQDAEATEIDLFRANWILRGAVLPEGEGDLVMRYDPQDYHTGAAVSRACSITLLLLLLLSILGCTRISCSGDL